MKNRTWLSLLAIGIVSMFALSSCSTETTAPADNTAPLYVEVDATNSYELFVEPMAISEGTLDAEPQLMEGRDAAGNDHQGDRRRGPHHRNPRGDDGMVHPFGRCLNQLDLSDEQVAAIREALLAHQECVHGAMEAYRTYMTDLLGKARDARHEIIAKVRAGEMTREEARDALRAIHERIRAAIESDGVRERIRTMLQGCDEDFRTALSSILTEEQLAQLRDCMNPFDDEDPSGDTGTGG